MDTTSSQQTETATEQTTNENNNNESENEIPNTKVTRDNVFDYVIKGINDSDGDASLIRFKNQHTGLIVIDGLLLQLINQVLVQPIKYT